MVEATYDDDDWGDDGDGDDDVDDGWDDYGEDINIAPALLKR